MVPSLGQFKIDVDATICKRNDYVKFGYVGSNHIEEFMDAIVDKSVKDITSSG